MAINIIQTADGALNLMINGLGNTPTLQIHLFDNALAAFNDFTVMSDVSECTFTGYAPVTPTWSPCGLSGTVASSTAGTANFTYGGASTTVVYGFFITDAGGTVWYGGNLFPGPVTLDPVTTTLQVQAVYTQESKY
jgi:hypothetical protein